jgi:hypothetical protein
LIHLSESGFAGLEDFQDAKMEGILKMPSICTGLILNPENPDSDSFGFSGSQDGRHFENEFYLQQRDMLIQNPVNPSILQILILTVLDFQDAKMEGIFKMPSICNGLNDCQLPNCQLPNCPTAN